MTTENFKCYKNSTLFDAQNAGNHTSELLDFKFFWGGTSQTPLGESSGPFSGHSCSLHLQWPLITNDIENPGEVN